MDNPQDIFLSSENRLYSFRTGGIQLGQRILQKGLGVSVDTQLVCPFHQKW
jgi:hypothetical protein